MPDDSLSQLLLGQPQPQSPQGIDALFSGSMQPVAQNPVPPLNQLSPMRPPQGINFDEEYRKLEEQTKALSAELDKPFDPNQQALQTLGDKENYRAKVWANSKYRGEGKVGKATQFLTDILRGLQQQPSLQTAVETAADKDYEQAYKDQTIKLQADRNQKLQQLQALKLQQAQLFQNMNYERLMKNEDWKNYITGTNAIRQLGGRELKPGEDVPENHISQLIKKPDGTIAYYAYKDPEVVKKENALAEGKMIQLDPAKLKELEDRGALGDWTVGDSMPTATYNKIIAESNKLTPEEKAAAKEKADKERWAKEADEFNAKVRKMDPQEDWLYRNKGKAPDADWQINKHAADLQNAQLQMALGQLREQDLKNKTDSTIGEQAAKNIFDNPDMVERLTPDIKANAEREWLKLHKEDGLPFPAALGNTDKSSQRFANQTMEYIGTISKMMADKPQLLARMGPLLGRIGKLEQKIGAAKTDAERTAATKSAYDEIATTTIPGLTPQEQADVQDFRTSLNYMIFGEGRAMFGARIPEQLMREFRDTSPDVKQTLPNFIGGLRAIRRATGVTLQGLEEQRFGRGNMRPEIKHINAEPPKALLDQLPEGSTKSITGPDGKPQVWVKRQGMTWRIQ